MARINFKIFKYLLKNYYLPQENINRPFLINNNNNISILTAVFQALRESFSLNIKSQQINKYYNMIKFLLFNGANIVQILEPIHNNLNILQLLDIHITNVTSKLNIKKYYEYLNIITLLLTNSNGFNYIKSTKLDNNSYNLLEIAIELNHSSLIKLLNKNYT